MVNYCVAYGCKSKCCRGSDISFHIFPADENRRKSWTNAIRRKNFTPSKYSRICSKHFLPECFNHESFGIGRKLNPDAIPTLFDFHKQFIPKKAKMRKAQKEQSSPLPKSFVRPTRTARGPLTSVSRFPTKRKDVLKKWVRAVKRKNWHPKPHSQLCSDHFSPDDYYQVKPGADVKRLKEDAIPKKFPAFPSRFQPLVVKMNRSAQKPAFIKDGAKGAKVSRCWKILEESDGFEEMAPQKMKKKKILVESDPEPDKKKTRLHICFADANDSPFGERGRSLTVEFDQTETCRLCLKRSDEPIEIFTQDKLKSSSKQYKINQLLGIEMAENDGLPRVICKACSARLEDLFLFHMESQNSNTILSASVELSSSSNRKKRAIDIYKDSDEDEESLERSCEEDDPEVSSDEVNENDSQLYQQPDSSEESCNENDYEHFKEEQNDNFFVIIGSRGSITGPAPQISPSKVESKSPRYPCPYCPKDFASNVWLLRHQKTHTEVNQKTSIPSPLANEIWLKLQKKTSTEIKQQTVSHITSPNESPGKEQPHDNGETLEDIKQFVSNSQNDSACEMYSDTKVQFECDICNVCFDYENELRNHQTEHFFPEVFTPPVRQSLSTLKEPTPSKKRKSSSLESRPVKKQNTSSFGNSPTSFATVNTKYVCVYCSRILVGKDTLQQHTKKHREDQPRVCKICTKTLRSEEQLALCVESHKGDPSGDFACKVCGVSFHYRTFVEFHAKVLHMDLVKQKYKCNQCKESFHLESDLLQHLKTHIGNVLPIAVNTDLAKKESHICQYCDKKFTTKTSLRKHILSWHHNPVEQQAESDEHHADSEEQFSVPSEQTDDFQNLPVKSKEHIPTRKNHPDISKRNLSEAAERHEENRDQPQKHKAIVISVESQKHIGENGVEDPANSKDSCAESNGRHSECNDLARLFKNEADSEEPESSLLACKDPHEEYKSDCVKKLPTGSEDHPAVSSIEHTADPGDNLEENKCNSSVSGNDTFPVKLDNKQAIELKEDFMMNTASESSDLPTESTDHCVDLDAESTENAEESECHRIKIAQHPTYNDNHPKNGEETAVVSGEHVVASVKVSTELDAGSVELPSTQEGDPVVSEEHGNDSEDHLAKSEYIATSGEKTVLSVVRTAASTENIAAPIEDSSELDSSIDNPSEQEDILTKSKHCHAVSEDYGPSFEGFEEDSASTEVNPIKSVHLEGPAEHLKECEHLDSESGDANGTPQTDANDEFDEWGISPAIRGNL